MKKLLLLSALLIPFFFFAQIKNPPPPQEIIEIDEEEFEVKPAITRSMLFFDTNTTHKDYGFGSPSIVGQQPINIYNENKFRRKLDFTVSETTQTITYSYNANVNLIRSNNVSGVTYTINGVGTQGNLEVVIGDVLIVTISKTSSGTAQVRLEEFIYF